jgi:protein-disulfide isomerase
MPQTMRQTSPRPLDEKGKKQDHISMCLEVCEQRFEPRMIHVDHPIMFFSSCLPVSLIDSTGHLATIVCMEHELPKSPSSGEGAGGNFLPVSILVAAVMVSGSVLYAVNRPLGTPQAPGPGTNNPPQAGPADPSAILVVGGRDVILGDPNAPVTLIEYSDFQCPFCGRFFSQTEPQIKETYVKSGKVRMIYRHLAFLGPESVEAAKASECAKDQGKFWVFHDALFDAEIKDGAEHNGNLNRELFMTLAGQVGMDTGAFAECYDANTYADAVTAETQKAQAAGVNATPTVFVNNQVIQGAQPFSNFQAAIDALQ